MITIDRQLVFAAKQMIDGANVHRINTLIFQYEQAIAVNNDVETTFVVDPKKYENKLRDFVYAERKERLG
jgi:hypothetical protein